jgi:UDP-N-acetylmuramate dehydrogenase
MIEIFENISLADKNWFKTGGSARFFCEPTTTEKFQQALEFATTKKLPVFILGLGANILISDNGFEGLVIRPMLTSITTKLTESDKAALVTAQAGVTMSDLISYCFDHNIIGLEEFSGIPSTIGGAAYINLHYFASAFSQFLVEATVVERSTGKLLIVDNNWFEYGYDTSKLQSGNFFLIDATLSLTKASDVEVAYARGRSVEIIRHRVSRYPSKNTCGSFFRNFHDHEVTIVSNNRKMIFVAYYLDKLGVKGELSHGDAIVSYQHANMLVNRGKATSNDIIQLARSMQQKVFDAFGVIPQPECVLVGFNDYPFLK